MTRAACPGKACICGYSTNPSLFSHITRTWASTKISTAKTRQALTAILEGAGIYLGSSNGEWVFPPGICRGVQLIIRTRLEFLGIEKPGKDLFSDLLPATGPDDESEPSTGSGGIPLVWDDDGGVPIVPSRAWNPNPEQLRLDE